jgi:hypothetical protein
MSIYDPLRDFLKQQKFREIELSFARIEQIIGRRLPRSAERPQREAWRAAGSDAFLIAGSRKVQFRRVG